MKRAAAATAFVMAACTVRGGDIIAATHAWANAVAVGDIAAVQRMAHPEFAPENVTGLVASVDRLGRPVDISVGEEVLPNRDLRAVCVTFTGPQGDHVVGGLVFRAGPNGWRPWEHRRDMEGCAEA